jgi:hypothetical protein
MAILYPADPASIKEAGGRRSAGAAPPQCRSAGSSAPAGKNGAAVDAGGAHDIGGMEVWRYGGPTPVRQPNQLRLCSRTCERAPGSAGLSAVSESAGLERGATRSPMPPPA